MADLEVKKTPEGKILARRLDGKPLSPEDREEARKVAQGEPDENPVVNVGQWWPEFHRLHIQTVRETPDFDYAWIRRHRPDLYRKIQTKEAELDALQEAKLSEVMAIMQTWRELILQGRI